MTKIGHAQINDILPRDQFQLTTTKARVAAVIDGETLIVDDNRIVYLPATYIPWETMREKGKYHRRAKIFLEEEFLNKDVRLYQMRNSERALKNALDHEAVYMVRIEDNKLAQELLIENGLAFAYPTQSHHALSDQFYGAENTAKDQKIGLWQEGDIGEVLTPGTANNIKDRFAIIEGEVNAVAARNNIVYLNFGEDWRDDLTVSFASSLRRDFSKYDMDVMNLGGQTIRARGWIRDYNGPYMEIFHPSQIEVIE